MSRSRFINCIQTREVIKTQKLSFLPRYTQVVSEGERKNGALKAGALQKQKKKKKWDVIPACGDEKKARINLTPTWFR